MDAQGEGADGYVAHGYLTPSLLIPLWTEILTVHSVHRKVNYGFERVHFPVPYRPDPGYG